MKLNIKMLIAFLVVGLTPFLFLGVISLVNSQKVLSDQAIRHLEGLRDAKKISVEQFFSRHLSNAKSLARVDSVIMAAETMEEAFDYMEGTIQGNYMWKALFSRYYPAMEKYVQEYGYKDLYLISPDGDVIFSVAQKQDLGQNIHGSLKNTPLAICFEKALHGSAISDFELYRPHENSPAAFTGAVIRRDEEIVGVLALYVSIELINEIMMLRSGLGKTGETYIVGSDKLIRSGFYHDPEKYLVKAALSHPEQGKVDTVASREALKGNTGAMTITDYRGTRVVSAYTPVQISDLTWALIAEINVSEAFAPIQFLRYLMTVIALIGVVTVTVVAFYVSRKITDPLKRLTKASEEIVGGKLDIELEPTLLKSNDEIGTLATYFSTMTRWLKQTVDDLRAENAERKEAEGALRESKEKYQRLVENLEQKYFFYSHDTAGVFEYISPSIINILGYSQDEFFTHYTEYLTDHPINEKVIYHSEQSIQGNKQPSYEVDILNKNGEVCRLEVSEVPFFDNEGNVIGVEGIAHDVTDRIKAEEINKLLEEQLQRSEKMEALGTLAGGVAHDLNNVLSGIVSYPDLILMELPADSPIRDQILIMQNSGKKAAAIVQDLLTLARRGVTVTEVTNFNDVINDYLKSPEYNKLKGFYPNIHIEADLEADLLNILASPVHLSKTVMNLVSNGAEAMSGTGTISISTRNEYLDRPIKGYDEVKEGDYIALTVTDEGIGIAASDLERIFEPFYTKKVMGRSGTGLGAAVVWGTVKDHKGYINVESIEGKGTTFKLYFPVTREKAEKEKSVSLEAYRGNGESVLVIDDVEEQRQIATLLLTNMGYSVHAVSSGEVAIEYLKTNPTDILILDMIMDPGLDGLDTYKNILEIRPGQKAIIASGFSETERVKEAIKLGVGQYIKKPYTLENISMAVKAELEK